MQNGQFNCSEVNQSSVEAYNLQADVSAVALSQSKSVRWGLGIEEKRKLHKKQKLKPLHQSQKIQPRPRCAISWRMCPPPCSACQNSAKLDPEGGGGMILKVNVQTVETLDG
jgi:hypothetical protein